MTWLPYSATGPLIAIASAWPAHTAIRHNTTDATIYALPRNHAPSWNSDRVCRLKAENVVYPPQRPVITNNLASSDTSRRPSGPVSAKNNPITNDPRILMNSVPHGKVAPNHAVAKSVHQCRATPPRALPIAIHRYVIIGFSSVGPNIGPSADREASPQAFWVNQQRKPAARGRPATG